MIRNVIFCFIFLAAICAASTSAQAQQKKNKHVGIVFIGNSITQGVGLKDREINSAAAKAAEYLRINKKMVNLAFSNQGMNGASTLNYLPSTNYLENVVKAADSLRKNGSKDLVFSIKLGGNDCAMFGPKGAPVAPADYKKNLESIVYELLRLFPSAKVVLNHPTWFSPNTMYGTRASYLQEGLDRLQSYFPQMDALVKEAQTRIPNHVFLGDTKAFELFRKDYKTLHRPENGEKGTFYLHPNEAGAVVLGECWAKAIWKIL